MLTFGYVAQSTSHRNRNQFIQPMGGNGKAIAGGSPAPAIVAETSNSTFNSII